MVGRFHVDSTLAATHPLPPSSTSDAVALVVMGVVVMGRGRGSEKSRGVMICFAVTQPKEEHVVPSTYHTAHSRGWFIFMSVPTAQDTGERKRH